MTKIDLISKIVKKKKKKWLNQKIGKIDAMTQCCPPYKIEIFISWNSTLKNAWQYLHHIL